MNVSWRDLLTLLRGKNNISETCEAVVDILQEDLPSIPDVFHEVVFNFLNSKAIHIRINGSKLLGALVLAFSDILERLISESSSDGKLFDLSDINIMKIVSNEDAFLLCRTDSDDINNSSESVYSKNWLEYQREELKSRIGLETNAASIDYSYANKYDEVNMCISSEDIKIVNSSQSNININEKSTEELPVALNTAHIDATSETWLTRLLRCLIVGLLNPNWEVRHGYSLGLTQILSGLYPQLLSPTHFNQTTRFLPEFICDDIMCCAVCVLLLDRLLDFGDAEGSSSISPVKETAGELLICALRCHCSSSQRQLLWNHIQTMLSLTNCHWTVSLGGYIALKHFIGLNIDMIIDTSTCYNDLIEMVSKGLVPDQSEDLRIAAYSCIEAMHFAFCTPNHRISSVLGTADIVQMVRGLDDFVNIMRMTAVEEPSGGVCSSPILARAHSTAVHSLCAILRYIVTLPEAITMEKEHVMDMCGGLLELLGHLQRGLFRYEASVRECCRTDLIGTLQKLSPVLQVCMSSIKQNKSSTDTTQQIRNTRKMNKNAMESTCANIVCEQLFALFGSILSCCMLSAKHPILDLRLAEIEDAKKSKPGRGSSSAAARKKLGAEVSEVDVSEGVETASISTQERVLPIEEAVRFEENRTSLAQLVEVWCECTVTVQNEIISPVGNNGQRFADLLRRVFCSSILLCNTTPCFDSINAHSCTTSIEGHQDVSEILTSFFCTGFRSTLNMFLQYEGLFSTKKNFNLWLIIPSNQRENLSIVLTAAVEYLKISKCVPETAMITLISALYQELYTQMMQLHNDISVLVEIATPLHAISTLGAASTVAQTVPATAAVKKRKFQFIIVPDKPSVARLPTASSSGVQTEGERGSAADVWKEKKRSEIVEKLQGHVQWLCGFAFIFFSLRIQMQQCRPLGSPSIEEIAVQKQLLAVLHNAYMRTLNLTGPSATTIALQRWKSLVENDPSVVLQQHELVSTEGNKTIPVCSIAAVSLDTALAQATASALLLRQACGASSSAGKIAPWQSTLTYRTLGSYEERVVFFLTKSWQLRVLDYMPELFLLSTGSSRDCEGVEATVIHRLRLLRAVLPALSTESKGKLLLQYDIVKAVLVVAATCRSQIEAPCVVTVAVDCVHHLVSRAGSSLETSSVLSGIAAHLFLLLGQHQLEASVIVVELEQTTSLSTAQVGIAVVAEIFLAVAIRYPAQLLSSYEVWFAAALHGLGNFDPKVRRACVRVFQLLVPLAPLARAVENKHRAAVQIKKDCEAKFISTTLTSTVQQLPSTVHTAAETAKELIEHIFTKQSMLRLQSSEHPRDQRILLHLTQMTNLLSTQTSFDDKLLPELSSARLRDYQWDGVSWLTQLRRFGLNGVLADEMGLGKSLQALTALVVLRLEKGLVTAPSLIVCPASVMLHWEDEVARYFPRQLLHAVRINKTSTNGSNLKTLDGADVVIVSYDTVRRSMSRGLGLQLQGRVWEAVILDEAHLIKNPNTATTQAVYALQAHHRIALTGTPVQNQVEELWSLMNYILPDYLGSYEEFSRESVRPIQRSFLAHKELRATQETMLRTAEHHLRESDHNSSKNKKESAALQRFHQAIEVSATGLNLLRSLHKQVLPFILRRTKAMVARDLPSKTIVDLLCPLSDEQQHMYDAYQKKRMLSDEAIETQLKATKVLNDVEREETGLSSAEVEEIVKRAAVQSSSTDRAPPSSGLGDGWGILGGGFALPALEDEVKTDRQQQHPLKTPVDITNSTKIHALEAVNYLNLLCVHPALVTDTTHTRYRQRLLDSLTCSGKLARLSVLLLECGITVREECADAKVLDSLLQVSAVADRVRRDCSTESSDSSEQNSDDEANEETPARNNKSTKTSSTKHQKLCSAGDTIPDTMEHVSKEIELETASTQPKHRCLIFAQHKAALDLVEDLVMRRHYPSVGYARLDGDLEPARRAFIARQFNEQKPLGIDSEMTTVSTKSVTSTSLDFSAQVDLLKKSLPTAATAGIRQKEHYSTLVPEKEIRLLLMTTRSCGLGLNLTAADTVIFLEHDWNPFADMQAMDRVHRIGQTQPVTVYRLLAEATIEERIMRLQGLKQTIAAQLINEANAGDTLPIVADSSSTEDQTRSGEPQQQRRQFGGTLLDSLLLRSTEN